MKSIGIFYGVKSVEHDISIITAMQVLKAKPKGCYFIPVYIMPDGNMVTAENLDDPNVYLNFAKNVKGLREVVLPSGKGALFAFKKNKLKSQLKLDCALLCNHGHGGEDGSLQGMLEMAEIPYTSCSVLSSAVTMDKAFTKLVLEAADIDTPAYLHICISAFKEKGNDFLEKIDKKIGFPCIVKPASLGSSVGISICADKDALKNSIEEAFKFDEKIVVEKYLKNAREFCCAVIRNSGKYIASRVCEVTKSEFYTFEEKYLTDKKREQKTITKVLESKIKELAISSYKALECDGVVRVDFLYDEVNKTLYVNEVNSIPGSLAFNLFDTSFGDLLMTLIEEARARAEGKKKIVYKFNSNAIEKYIEMTSAVKTK